MISMAGASPIARQRMARHYRNYRHHLAMASFEQLRHEHRKGQEPLGHTLGAIAIVIGAIVLAPLTLGIAIALIAIFGMLLAVLAAEAPLVAVAILALAALYAVMSVLEERLENTPRRRHWR